MTDKYVCGLCGTTHYDLDDYLNCVARCGKELKQREEAEKKRKRLEEVNAAISKLKAAKNYYQEQLDDFREKYPEEYRLNFFNEGVNECPYDCKGFTEDEDDFSKTINVQYNEKDVASEKLCKDHEAEFILKLLGIL